MKIPCQAQAQPIQLVQSTDIPPPAMGDTGHQARSAEPSPAGRALVCSSGGRLLRRSAPRNDNVADKVDPASFQSGWKCSNAREASIAARSVAAGAHASYCTAQIGRFANDPKRVAQFHAQAASMGREKRGFIGALLRLQAARRKREADDTTCDSDALTTQCVLGMLQQGLESLPPGPPVPAAPPPAPAEPERTRPLAFSR